MSCAGEKERENSQIEIKGNNSSIGKKLDGCSLGRRRSFSHKDQAEDAYCRIMKWFHDWTEQECQEIELWALSTCKEAASETQIDMINFNFLSGQHSSLRWKKNIRPGKEK